MTETDLKTHSPNYSSRWAPFLSWQPHTLAQAPLCGPLPFSQGFDKYLDLYQKYISVCIHDNRQKNSNFSRYFKQIRKYISVYAPVSPRGRYHGVRWMNTLCRAQPQVGRRGLKMSPQPTVSDALRRSPSVKKNNTIISDLE